MAAARGMHKGVYVSDILGPGTQFTQRVDDHLFTQAALGWTSDPGGLTPVPRTMVRRHGVGKDASGRTHKVTIATTTADLWTRTATTWQILDDTGALQTVDLTGLVGEAVTF